MSLSVVERLAQLVKMRSDFPGGDETALATLLEAQLKEHAPDAIERVRVPRASGGVGSYVWARWGNPRLLLNAHLDTVPPNAGWSGDPFTARIIDDRMIGLGTADTKGAIAAILCGLDKVRPRDVIVLFSGDEEHGGTCMRHFLGNGRGRGVEKAVVCEPTGLRPGVRHRGIMELEAEVYSEGGHSSRADLLAAPVAELARVAVAWDNWGRGQRDRGPAGFLGMCMNIAKLEGGVAFNVIPTLAVLSASLRPPPGADSPALGEELLALGQAASLTVKLRVLTDNPSFATRDLASFAPLIGDATQHPVDLAFWTEAALLSAHKIDAVVIGPGDIAQAHAPDEWVSLAELAAAETLFTQILRSTTG